ncbi:MAG TPA: hypothetical protein VMF11_06255 [Candidatus Baltobacteraceae bacterium]|nr:hypothetical protein [Candidatus Baltobacteraceae bacterium]
MFAIVSFVAVATAAFADPRLGVAPVAPVHPVPVASAVLAPARAMATMPPNGAYVGAVPPGTVVPLSRLPRLPMRTSMNTVTPKGLKAGHFHIMAASGATIDITGTSCGGALGDIFPVDCTITWQAINLPATDSKQDYYIAAENGNELTSSATAVGTTGRRPEDPYTATTGPSNTTEMTEDGTYIFGTYDVTKSEWIAVVYVNAGQVFTLEVFSDPYHSSQTYQFDAADSPDAYIYLQNVAQSDYYVVGVHETGVNPNCIFMAPVPTPSPYTYSSSQLCDLTASSGVQAPGGDLSVTWPISSSDPAGNYSVEVYDLTQGQRLGQVQVSLTGSTGIVLASYPDDSGANSNPSPAPPIAATPSTILAWDGGAAPGPADESVTGIKTTVSGLQNGTNYLWTLSDPQGQVVGTANGTITGSDGSNIFTFDDLSGGAGQSYIEPPGRYPAKSWVVQLYNTTSKTVSASQSFQILGYSTSTQFNASGTLETSMALTPGGTAVDAGLRITNASSTVFNGYGDNLAKVSFSSGNDFNPSGGGSGNGIMVGTSATAPCSTVCSTTGTDENGNTWPVTITCSTTTLTTSGECTIEADAPSGGSVFLTPGEYVEVDGLYWFDAAASTCGNSCQGLTSELPQHGLHWSCIYGQGSCPSDTLAWVPVYFRNASATASGTASFAIIGSYNESALNDLASPYTPPFVNAHWFQDYFEQADYAETSPYDSPIGAVGDYGGTNMDVDALTITNSTDTNNITEVAVVYPPVLHDQSWLALPGGNGWGFATCPNNFRAATICYDGGNIAKGKSDTITIYQTPTLQSFPFQDLQVLAYDGSQWFQLTPASESISTPDGLYTNLDALSVGQYSLIANDMTAYFDPDTVGNGSTATLGFVYTNTSTAVDANPDSIDALVLEAPSTGYTLSTTGMTISAPGWSYLGAYKPNGATTTQYWFGLCATQFTNGSNTGTYSGPPTASGGPGFPLTAKYPTLGNPATCGTEHDAIKPGGSITVSGLSFSNFNTNGTLTWYMYAHGINGGGWSDKQTMSLAVASASASVWFNEVDGTAVASNTTPTIGSSPNDYQYAIENTSKSTNITSIAITLPGTDINGQNAYDGTNYWEIPNIDTAGTITLTYAGANNPTCTVNTTAADTYNATSGGANGQIYITCTNFKAGYTLYVNFPATKTMTNPEEESDSYVFPATINGTTAAGTAWLGSDEINEQFSIGLDVVVDPSNPGPGGSTPVVNCGNTCAFSGNTIDFGNIANNQSFTFQDVVRASMYYTGTTSSGHNLDLYVEANANPTNTSGSPTNELQTEVDQSHSTSATGMSFLTTAYTVVPTSTMLELATAPETYSSTPYDIINSYEVSIGPSDPITAQIITLTYTLIAN